MDITKYQSIKSRNTSPHLLRTKDMSTKRCHFGLVNAPATFQRTIQKIVKRTGKDNILAYMDDILIPSRTVEEGLNKLENLLKLLREEGLTLRAKKCKFLGRVEYLGFEISKDGIRPGIRKIEAIREFRRQENVHEIRQFLGLVSFFRRFVDGHAKIVSSLAQLTRKDVEFKWGELQENAFQEIKRVLTGQF